MTGTAQRPALDDLMGDGMHRRDATSNPVGELRLVVRLDRIHGDDERWTERLSQDR